LTDHLTDFKIFNLDARILEAIIDQGYRKPTPIQIAAIPAIKEGKDVLGIAETGSGKTASYVLPILDQFKSKFVSKNRHIDTLIMVPTRELAVQVEKVFGQFVKNLFKRPKVMAVYGGASINPQMINLQGVSILIATPGRLIDLVESKALHLTETSTLVLDEADKMLNLGFKDEMSKIIDLLPSKRQNILLSATLSEDLASLKEIILRDPLTINIKPEEKIESDIKQYGYFVTDERKGPFLRYLIKQNGGKQVLVFASSTTKADKITEKLKKNKIDAVASHGKKSMAQRTNNLDKFKSGEVQVLVATDMLSRGIDILELPIVINYELPRSPKDFVHRIGRTGRAGAKGEAISLVTAEELRHFKVILKKNKLWLDMHQTDDIDLHGY
jgi:ATP-dependent RNA helicase RhlE